MFDKSLISKINSGRCLILVGSGPSCEMGYPSWGELSELTYNELHSRSLISDSESYLKYLRKGSYAELFRQAERDLSDRNALVNLIKPLLRSNGHHSGEIYRLIANWPFACYLTTNYDDEIYSHLKNIYVHYTVVRNRPEDFHIWRDGTTAVIQKLHSDLNHPEELILTSTDYDRLDTNSTGQYYRHSLTTIFSMFDVLIIGHSLSDPDIKLILKSARNLRDPLRPIYMVASGYTKADEQEMIEKYNIELITYPNTDGTHSELLKLLRSINSFIVPRRNSTNLSIPQISNDETKAAMTIYLYRRLQGIQDADYLSPLIISGLSSTELKDLSLRQIRSLPILRSLLGDDPIHDASIDSAVTALALKGLVDESENGINITDSGRSKVKDYQRVRELQIDQAYGQFRLHLKGSYPATTDEQLRKCEDLAEEVIVANFSDRGSMIVNRIFSVRSAGSKELTDVFGCISDRAITIDDTDLRLAFIAAMHEFIIQPNQQQREYLASVSQGYFLYHLLGRDPKWHQIRQRIFRETLWLCDSSVLLPRVAIGCHNHDHANDLFRMLNSENAFICTTSKLLQETWTHFEWACDFMRRNGSQSLEFLRAALVKGSFRQNLFLDGYVRLSADGIVGTFQDYIRLIVPDGRIDRSSFEANLNDVGLQIIDVSSMSGFDQKDWGDMEHVRIEIQDKREQRGTYRSTHQVDAEAEVAIIFKNLKSGKYTIEGRDLEHFYFVSQSQIIGQANLLSPEALYRCLSSLPGGSVDPGLLQQCMLHEYYYAGVSFIDRERYERFFGSSIDESKASFGREVADYIRDQEDGERFMAAFDQIPDLEKPFFITQMGWRSAEEAREREELTQRKLLELETKIRHLEMERNRAWKVGSEETRKQELARSRNLKDPKHLRKRRRQAKKRRKKRD